MSLARDAARNERSARRTSGAIGAVIFPLPLPTDHIETATDGSLLCTYEESERVPRKEPAKVERESVMITMQLTVDVKDDRRIVLTLPPDVPIGPVELRISVAPPATPKKPRTSLAQWADANAEDWDERIQSDDAESFTGRRF